MYEYEKIRPMLKTGDLVLFQRLPWRGKYLQRKHWHDLGGYLSNWLISRCQFHFLPGYDGFWNFVHCGVIVRKERDTGDPDRPDEVLLAEIMAMGALPDIVEGRRRPGLTVCKLSERIKQYQEKGGNLGIIPIRLHELSGDDPVVGEVLDEFRKFAYNYSGLRWAVTWRSFGKPQPGKMFCSEAVVHFWLDTKLIPATRTLLRRNDFIKFRYQPQEYGPVELARMHEIVDAQDAMMVDYLGEPDPE